MSKLRVAFFSPFSPQRSGISAYSEELLPYLGDLAEVTLVSGPYRPSPWLVKRFPVIGIEEFLRAPSRCDVAIYQVGNSVEHHGYMIECTSRLPGIVVLHDYCLHYLILGLTLMRGDFGSLEAALQVCYGSEARVLARKLLFAATDPFQLSFAGPLIERSKAVLMHSRLAEQCVRKNFPAKRVQVIPMGVPLGERPEAESGLRSKYGLQESDFVVASINSPAYNKRLDLVLQALRLVRQRFSQARLVILSGAHFGAKTRELLSDPILKQAVVCPGWLSSEAYHEYIRLADVVVDMRYPSGVETSASLMRAIAAGKALVVSAQGTFLELPDSCCIKIEVREGEMEELAQVLASLIETPQRVATMGIASREFAHAELRLDVAAHRYLKLAMEVASSPASENWSAFPAGEPSAAKRFLVSSTYRAFRTASFLLQYGISETVGRVLQELRAGDRRGSRA